MNEKTQPKSRSNNRGQVGWPKSRPGAALPAPNSGATFLPEESLRRLLIQTIRGLLDLLDGAEPANVSAQVCGAAETASYGKEEDDNAAGIEQLLLFGLGPVELR